MSTIRPAKRNGWSCSKLFRVATALFLMLPNVLVATASVHGDSEVNDSPIFTSHTAPAQWKHLEDASVGFTLYYPPDWTVDGQVVATQFTTNAKCRSVRFFDFEPPPDSGAAAPVQQSFVQVCSKPLDQDDSLDRYMDRVYGESLQQRFVLTDLNGTRSYQTKEKAQSVTIFAQPRTDLIQIVASVTTSHKKYFERQEQVEKILRSLMML